MFGTGIYSSTASSSKLCICPTKITNHTALELTSPTHPFVEADTYAKNYYIRSQLHAVIVCTVVRGFVNHLSESNTSLVDAGDDYDTVEGLNFADGGSINYPETVVYHEDRILPRAVIMYTREGWTPP